MVYLYRIFLFVANIHLGRSAGSQQKGSGTLKVLQTILREKTVETGKAVLPVIGIVLVLCFSIAPISPGILMAFLVGAVLLMVGMILFSLGVEMSMTPMGERVGTCMTKTGSYGS